MIVLCDRSVAKCGGKFRIQEVEIPFESIARPPRVERRPVARRRSGKSSPRFESIAMRDVKPPRYILLDRPDGVETDARPGQKYPRKISAARQAASGDRYAPGTSLIR